MNSHTQVGDGNNEKVFNHDRRHDNYTLQSFIRLLHPNMQYTVR